MSTPGLSPAKAEAIAARRARVAELHQAGHATRTIADHVNVSIRAVRHDLRVLGLAPHQPRSVRRNERQLRVAQLHQAGHSNAEITGTLGISRELVTADLRALARAVDDWAHADDSRPCPHCPRPAHRLPAIAAPALRLPACPGTRQEAA